MLKDGGGVSEWEWVGECEWVWVSEQASMHACVLKEWLKPVIRDNFQQT
jgi:phage gp16-like protein